MLNSSWWSPAKSGGSPEQEDKGKGSPVEGVVQPGALITVPPPREVARPEVKKSLVPVGNLDEEEWVTVYGRLLTIYEMNAVASKDINRMHLLDTPLSAFPVLVP
ncbi:UNVERIFIED_CONTAM: Nuclear pore complex protein [Sesamum latifolium]|uniref:Nuclear pore complex protein n=1 Tax=Sesamum latifolium TaxID=2727402 RepID=A0AAW2UCY7_9LAMI